ncbi:helicase SRCAP isoform X1 [Astyanax mexicanus]|uniref:helicase SRCAP isoform X1 n=1 Tax=Astyanax mexicanus TaxID=7994 RepID=UPI0020CB6764|nr:helicase SRCAP isoform X1 [Astyanax mexicanus]
MAEGADMGHCQNQTSNTEFTGDVAVEMEMEPLASEKACLEFKSNTDPEALPEALHTAGEITHLSPSLYDSSVCSEATDRDQKQPGYLEQSQNAPLKATITATSSEPTNTKNTMQDHTKENSIGSGTKPGEKVGPDYSEFHSNSAGLPAKQEEPLSKRSAPRDNGNGTPNDTDEGDGYLPKCLQPPPLAAVEADLASVAQRTVPNVTFSHNTPVPVKEPLNAQAMKETQLSPDYVNCSGTPIPVLQENMTGESGEQGSKNQGSVDGDLFGSVAVTDILYDISVEVPKVPGDGTCPHNVESPKVTEGSQAVLCGSADLIVKQNDCANSIQVTVYPDRQPDESSLLQKCTTSEGLDSDQPCLSQTSSDCLIQHGQDSIPTDHKLSQIICVNDGFSIPGNLNVDDKQTEDSEELSGLSAVEVKNFIDVGILMQPGMEDTWLVVSESSPLIDGQCESTEDAEMIDVSTEAVMHCPESQSSVTVYECTMPCFPSDSIHEDVKLLLTDKVDGDHADKHSFEPLTETLSRELDALSSYPESVLASQIVSSCTSTVTPMEKLSDVSTPQSCMQNVFPKPTVCSSVASTLTLSDLSLINTTSSVQEENVELTENKPDVSHISLSSGVIDPKLLILKRGETPLLKHPPSMLAKISRNQDSAVQSSTPNDGLDTVSVECLFENDSAVDPMYEDTAGPSEKEALASSSFSSTSIAPNVSCLSTKDDSEKKTAENESQCSPGLETQTPQHEPLSKDASSAPAQTSAWSSVCSAISERNQSKQSSANQPCQDSMSLGGELEVEEQHSPVQHLAETKDAENTTQGQLDATIEESSDGDADSSMEAQTDDSIHVSSSAQNKVRQWIAGRATAGSTPCTSRTPSPPPASSSGDWNQLQSDRAAPLCGSHGKQTSSQASGGASQSDQMLSQRPRSDKHADMAELAKHEADIEHRTLALKREGFWSLKRLSRVTEPVRPKVHWDYLCEEMQWLSADFAQERRWKRGVARKVVRMVMRHHEELRQKEERAKREEQAKLRRVAASIAKEVRTFWSSVEKVVQYKQQSRLEEKRKKALDLQLDFIVGQTERYSDLLSQSLHATPTASTSVPLRNSQINATDEDDRDFEPPCEEEDDEETIEVEEQQEGNDAETQRREIELLRQEGTLPLDQLLSTFTLPQGSPSEEVSENSSLAVEDEDKEFSANEEDAEDVEDTIEAQEKVEGDGDHEEELDDLAREGEMSMEELLEKYRGAYASDFEEPSASPESSDESEGTEEEEEEETEGDDSGDESGTSSDSAAAEDSDEEEDAKAQESDKDEEEDDGGEGMEILLREGDHSPTISAAPRPKKEISHIAATAESLQPKGYTLATTKVKTPIPFLLHGNLREYQHIGLDWLVTMYEKKLNGILADEMGLGKTIQTIALLAHLACEKGNWGPHLIIVPTSVMLNWEMELKRWCPGFKILTYYGSQKERKLKRQGWTKPNAFHVCITSYKLVLQDHQAFRRKSWRYLILDEAQNIKNFKSQRWQSLLNFNSHRRLLLTGTPLQNSLMELWSLMHFLMPHVFQSHREFKEWFSNPLTGMIEGSQEYNEGLVKRLHKVLRPFLLRRIKVDVEKQMPKKYEHVVRCRLSKRQRFLYDDFMAQASTRETLASGHFMSVINILMQLRKVCNHPNLFDPRPIHSPFITEPIIFSTASLVTNALEISPFQRCDLSMFDLVGLERRVTRHQADVYLPRRKVTHQLIQEIIESPEPPPRPKPVRMKVNRMFQPLPKSEGRSSAATTNNPRPMCPVSPAVQPPRPPLITEVTPTQPPVQPAPQVCPVTVVSAPRAPVGPSTSSTGAAVRPSAPHPVMAVRPPAPPSTQMVPASPQASTNVMTQRVLLSPDMQARLPSGEVVSIAQLASLAGRPVSSSQGSKPVTFQLQGNKLTLSGAPLHQVPVPQPRPIQGNVMHLVSSGGQHHLISQPAQVAVLHTVSQTGSSSANPSPGNTTQACSGLAVPLTAAQVPSTMVSGPGIVKIVVRQAAGKDSGQVPTLAVPPSPRVAPPQSVLLHPHGTPSPVLRPPTPQQPPHRPPVYAAPPRAPTSGPSQPPPTCPVLKVVQGSAPSAGLAKVNASLGREESSSDVSQQMGNPKPASQQTQSNTFALQRPRVQPPPPPRSPFYLSWLAERRKAQRDTRISQIIQVNEVHCNAKPVYGKEVLDFLTFLPGPRPTPARPVINSWSHSGYRSCLMAQSKSVCDHMDQCRTVQESIHNSEERLQLLSEVIERFTFVIPPVEAKPITMHCCHPPPSHSHQQALFSSMLSAHVSPLLHVLHRVQCNMRTHFPDLRLIQYDCGKLQTLHLLLRKLKTGGHRVLIFTQMTRMLDVLEQFLNYHGHIYLRLDGSTRVEQRQALMERFNADRRIFCFILSTRSGGVGVNLTGADTVVFYDSDWNPTMDAQAQDRCHRIGQTRDVHIYRLISERTVEENILKKANQKRMLGDMAIEGGNFTTAFFKQQTIRELFDVTEGEKKETESTVLPSDDEEAVNKQQTNILEQALCRAEDEEDIVAASQAKAEQVAELAEFNENIPLDDGESRDQEEEELSKAEQEIAALVEQLTPIERYAMNFLEASLEDICKEELKQAEEQVEAARKGLDQAKEEGLKLHQSSDNDEEDSMPPTPEEHLTTRRTRKHKEKGAPSTRVSGRLRGTPANMDDVSITHPSPDKERGKKVETLVPEPGGSRSSGSSSSLKSPQPREVPERIRSGLRGRGAIKELVASPAPTKEEPVKPQTDQDASDSEAQHSTQDLVLKTKPAPSPLQQPLSPSESVPSDAAPPSLERGSTGHLSVATPVQKEEEEESVAESQSGTPQQDTIERERGASISSDSICSPEQLLEQDGQHSLTSHPRSPRKRQTADGEVLKGLPEDSPSAKVLRKLPGRLVTVVEEKEPRRRRRGASGSGGIHTEGSSEEVEQVESVQDTTSHSPDQASQLFKEKPLPKSPSTSPPPIQQGQEQVSPSSSLSSPGRGYQPYSPTHSPDMPVLRNLPVRRRLETESRMAAQLGEQYVGRGRGIDRRTPLSPKKQESTTSPTVASDPNATNLTPVKRKRGRPRKAAPKPQETTEQEKSVVQGSRSEEQSPPHSPKRKRGRPRKNSTVNIALSGKSGDAEERPTTLHESPSQESLSALNISSPVSSVEPVNLHSVPECAGGSSALSDSTPPQKTVSETSQSNVLISPAQTLDESEIKLTDTELTPNNEHSTLKTTIPHSDSLNTLSQPEVIPTANISQTNITPSLQPVATTSDSSSCQSSQVTISPSQPAAVTSNDSTPQQLLKSSLSGPEVLAMSTELVAQASPDNTVTATDPEQMSPSPTTILQSSPTPSQPSHELSSEPAVANNSSPTLPASGLTEPPVPLSDVPEVPDSLHPMLNPNTPPEAQNELEKSGSSLTSESVPSPALPNQITTEPSHQPLLASTEEKPEKSGSSLTSESVPSPALPNQITTEPFHQPLLASTEEKPEKSGFSLTSESVPSPALPNQITTEPSHQPLLASTEDKSEKLGSSLTSESVPSPALPNLITEPPHQPLQASIEETTHNAHSPAKQCETKNLQASNASEVDEKMESTEDMEVGPSENSEQVDSDGSQVLAKRRRLDNMSDGQISDSRLPAPSISEAMMQTASESDGTDKPVEEERQAEEQENRTPCRKRSIRRQSSQESVRSSSPSSISSCGTRSSRSKRAGESKIPVKRKRETDSEKDSTDRGTDKEPMTPARRQSSNSSQSSSDSEDSSSPKRRFTRSQKSLEKETRGDKGDKRRKRRSDKNSLKANVEGESRGATPVRVTRKSTGLQPASQSTITTPEPEVLGKRCSALNAAAKLLAMRGRAADTPSPKSKAIGQQSPTEKSSKSLGNSGQDSPKTNLVSKTASGQQTPTHSSDSSQSTTKTTPSVARSTRQRPGNLVPPLETEIKKPKREEKKKTDTKEEVEDERRETRSSRGHSACSSISSGRGAGSSRSRSSSNSSQCTRSLSSRSTGPPRLRSRAPSSGSDTEKEKSKQRKTGESRGRESRRERRSQKHERPELSAGSSEGTPDRVLRSVAALAAAQARTPASNTRSSTTQQRKT